MDQRTDDTARLPKITADDAEPAPDVAGDSHASGHAGAEPGDRIGASRDDTVWLERSSGEEPVERSAGDRVGGAWVEQPTVDDEAGVPPQPEAGYGVADAEYAMAEPAYGPTEPVGYGVDDAGYRGHETTLGGHETALGSAEAGYGPGEAGYGLGEAVHLSGDPGYGPGGAGHGFGDPGYGPGAGDGGTAEAGYDAGPAADYVTSAYQPQAPPAPDWRSRHGSAGNQDPWQSPAADPSAPARQPTSTAPPRQARLAVARFDPWSVMKFSFMISLVCFVILFVAVAVLYGALAGLGVFDAIQHAVANVTSSQGSAGINTSKWFSASTILSYTAMVGAFDVVVITALATIGSVIYNLVSHLVGGIEVTLRETE